MPAALLALSNPPFRFAPSLAASLPRKFAERCTPPSGLHLRSNARSAMYQPAFAPSRISLSLKALHSALRAPFAQQRSLSHEQPAFSAARIWSSKPAFAPSRISYCLKALHSALKGSICAATLAQQRKNRIRTQPHFALPESAALRPSGYICAATLAQP